MYTLELHQQLSLILFAKQYFHQPKLSNKIVKPHWANTHFPLNFHRF